jgi:nicotinate phosphoribosyltransferase
VLSLPPSLPVSAPKSSIHIIYRRADEKFGSALAKCVIIASNDLNENILLSLAKQGHSIDAFGIGTNLVTCQAQPALGMVFKLVELNGEPRIKLSQDSAKITIPGAKEAFRLVGSEGVPLLDMMIRQGESRPTPGRRVLARAAFEEKKRVYVTPSVVIPLLRLVWCGARATVPHGLDDADAAIFTAAAVGAPPGSMRSYALRAPSPSLEELRAFCAAQVRLLREDHLRPLNPTPYKVSVSTELFHFIHDLLLREVPIRELE